MTVEAAKESESQLPGAEPSSGSEGNTQQMIKRVIGQRDRARGDSAAEADINQDLLNRNVTLQRQIDVLMKSGGKPADQSPGEEPTLESCGGDEAKFKTEYKRFVSSANDTNIEKLVDSKFQARSDQSSAEENDQNFKEKVSGHYDRADKMEVTDYEQAETEALTVMGSEIIEGITKKISNSEQLIYMLGKKPEEALRLKNLFAKDPSGATIEIGRLSAIAASYKNESAANPESGIASGGFADGQLGVLERKLDKAFDSAADTGNLDEVRAIKKEIRALAAK